MSGGSLGGRPPVGPEKAIRLPVSLWARVETDAYTFGLARSAMVRRIVETYYAAQDNLARTRPTKPEEGKP
jgi:hypothetical protein